MGYTELDSILGQSVPEYVLNQLRIRSQKTLNPINEEGTEGARDNSSLVYTANKSAWIRVVSSVNVVGSYADRIKELIGLPANNANLAKNFVLFGGTSAYNGTRNVNQIVPDRDLDFTNDFSSADVPNYKLKPYFDSNKGDFVDSLDSNETGLVDREYGLRPMVGITAAKITTQGKLGSILQADIDFKVNTKRQLDAVDILYFKLGYTMFIEWGNTFFYKQKNPTSKNLETYEQLQKTEDYSIDPFEKGLDEEKLRIKISKAIRQTEGNYCAMVGIVTNFTFTSNTEGGYDCKLKVLGKGLLAESMRANAVPTLPEVYKDAIAKIANLITTINKTKATEDAKKRQREEQEEENRRYEREKNDPNNPLSYPPCIKQYLDSSQMAITTFANETYAEQRDINLSLLNYGFFGIPSGFKYFIRESTNGRKIKESTYKCVGENILDKNDDRILGTIPPKTNNFNDIYNYVKTGTGPKTNDGNLRYEKIGENRFSYRDPSLTDYGVKDLSVTEDRKRFFYLFDRFDKLIYIEEDFQVKSFTTVRTSTDLRLPQLKSIALNRDGVYRDYTSISSGGVATWKNILFKGSLYVKESSNVFATTLWYKNPDRGVNEPTKLFIAIDRKFYKADNVDYKSGFNNVKEWKFGSLDIYKDVDRTKESALYTKVTNTVADILNNSTDARFRIIRFPRYQYTPPGSDRTWDSPSYQYVLELYVEEDLPGTITFNVTTGGSEVPPQIVEQKQTIKIAVYTVDVDLILNITSIDNGFETPTSTTTTSPSAGGPAIIPLGPITYETVSVEDLQKSEAAMYKSQLEAMLRTVQMTTIAKFINNSGDISEVSYIDWTTKAHSGSLYKIFEDGAMGNGKLKTVLENSGSFLTSDNINNYYGELDKTNRYLINMYCGFHRGLMKDNGVDTKILPELVKSDSEYRIRFNEILRSYVVPYYQKKNLVEGGDIHYPTYVTLGYFFMMMNHCAFLYDTTEKGLNLPIVYLDYNQGSNIILSSDFMLSANPYRFIVPFRGNIDSYRKLFGDRLLTSDKNSIIAVSSKDKPTKLWTTDALSKHLPPFKFETSNSSTTQNYRGKLMNALVSIDYLLDVIRMHATRDETNSVYVRSLLDELITDLGKALGNYNILRLAYDDSSNCFYIVDDQSIPGDNVYYQKDENILESPDPDLPVFGKNSIAKEFTIQTDNSTKLASQLAISANADVENQSTAGIDATSIGNSSLYAEDRYKPVVTTANDNTKNQSATPASGSPEDQRRAIAATRFNQTVDSFYRGGSRSEDGVEQATNYYIEAVARTRNTGSDSEIRSTMLLPLTVNFSTDGISGLGIYQAFTISEQLLPYSYTVAAGGLDQNYTKRVGFIVTGLDHTIQGNTWTTDVKANMYYVKNKNKYKTKPAKQTEGKWTAIPKPVLKTEGGDSGGSGGGGGGRGGGSPDPAGCVRKSASDNSWKDNFPYRGYQDYKATPNKTVRTEYRDARARADASGLTSKYSTGIKVLAEAQTSLEGFTSGPPKPSTSYRTKNPGNIGTNTNKGAGNEGRFNSLEEGIQAQLNYIYRAATKQHWAFPKGGETTLYEYLFAYAPPCYTRKDTGEFVRGIDDPTAYTNSVINYIKYVYGLTVTAQTTLNDIVNISGALIPRV